MTPAQVAILEAGMEAVLPRLDLAQLHGQRLFITGGTGFFGLWLLTALRSLQARQVHVQVCVLSRDPAAFLRRHPQFRDQAWLNFVQGNVRDFEFPEQRFDLVLHAATETSMTAHAQPGSMFDDIVLGTRRVLELADRSGARRILLVSSGAVYGPQAPGQLHQADDSSLACNPLLASSAYGEGKRVMELLGAIEQQRTGIAAITARCFAFSGPGLPLEGHFALGNFVRDALYGEKITVQGDGSPMRSYLFGADLAVWLLHLLLQGQAGLSYNVGSDQALSIQELALRVRDLLAPDKQVLIAKPREVRPQERQCYVPAIHRARALGCDAWTSLEQSLQWMAGYGQAQRTDQ